jgi:hypothetical protein
MEMIGLDMASRIEQEPEPYVLYRLIDDQEIPAAAARCATRAFKLLERSENTDIDDLSGMPVRLLRSQLHNSLAVVTGDAGDIEKGSHHFKLALVSIRDACWLNN